MKKPGPIGVVTGSMNTSPLAMLLPLPADDLRSDSGNDQTHQNDDLHHRWECHKHLPKFSHDVSPFVSY